MTVTAAPSRMLADPVLLDRWGQPLRRAVSRVSTRQVLRARYDAAQTTAENSKLWAMTDGFSARAANSADVRKTLRERARYEIANNSFANGMVRTLVHDVIGTGPRLQLLEPDAEFNDLAGTSFGQWAEAARLDEKLQTLTHADIVDGEGFALYTFRRPSGSAIPLGLRLYEADQVALPFLSLHDPTLTDGIILDGMGDPVSYTLLDRHPGDFGQFAGGLTSFQRIPAELMAHLYRCDRPGQVRGVPLLMPALPLFAELRRFTLAVIAAAESAADVSGVIQSNSPTEDPDDIEPLEPIDYERRMLMTLPRGWSLAQLRAEQPATTYAMFTKAILTEIARCLCMPYNVAAGDSGGMNFSSGRLDHRKYDQFIKVFRRRIECRLLNPLLRWWWEMAELFGEVPPLPADSIRRTPRFEWRWPGSDPIDPVKESNADATDIANGSSNLAIVCGRRGLDWEQVLRQRAREQQLAAELGLDQTAGAATGLPDFFNEDDEDEE